MSGVTDVSIMIMCLKFVLILFDWHPADEKTVESPTPDSVWKMMIRQQGDGALHLQTSPQ